MNLIQARELTIKYLEPFLTENRFTIKLTKNKEAIIERKRDNGVDTMGMRLLDYNPSFRIENAFSKTNNTINTIMMQLQSRVKLQFEYDKKSRFLSFSYNSINNPSETSYLPYMSTEQELQASCHMAIEFMKETALPLLDKFEDLRELDKVINGDEPWDDDWFKPYNVGNNFGYYRLIVAKLAGHPNFDQLVDTNYKLREALSLKNGHPYTYDRNDLNKPMPALIEILNATPSLY